MRRLILGALLVGIVCAALAGEASAAGCASVRVGGKMADRVVAHNMTCGTVRTRLKRYLRHGFPRNQYGWYCTRSMCSGGNGGGAPYFTFRVRAASAQASSSRYRAYISCGIYGRPDQDCMVGDLPYANFRDLRASGTRYKLCVARPTGRTLCRMRTTGARGSTHRVPLPSENVGWHRVTWSRNGRVIKTVSYYMNIGD